MGRPTLGCKSSIVDILRIMYDDYNERGSTDELNNKNPRLSEHYAIPVTGGRRGRCGSTRNLNTGMLRYLTVGSED